MADHFDALTIRLDQDLPSPLRQKKESGAKMSQMPTLSPRAMKLESKACGFQRHMAECMEYY